MSTQPTVTYTNFWVYTVDSAWRHLDEGAKQQAREEFAALLESASAEGITVRGAYSTVGLHADADMFFWVLSESFDALQNLAVMINRTSLGKHLTMRNAYPGLDLGSRYTADHSPAFIKGLAPKRYLSMYPFVKTHAWYQLSFEDRRAAMAEHGLMGREYPEIMTNTVSSFGIGDHEFVVAFESDDLAGMVRMVEHPRSAASRPYTKLDTPIFLGVRKDVAEVLSDLA